MNISNKQKEQLKRQRNITPSFLRFKKQPKQQQNKGTQRSSSKASKGSFDVYQKRILNLSRLKNTITSKKKNQQQKLLQKKPKIVKIDIDTKRISSHQKQSLSNSHQRENISSNNNNRLNSGILSKKKSSGSGNLIKPKSKQRYSNPKRNQQSLQKQQQRAKLQNNDLLNNLMKHQHVPTYMNKLKIKKQQTSNQIKKSTTLATKQKKNFFEDESINLKSEQKLKNYEIYGELGKGAYGIVKMALDKLSKQKVAIKIYEKSKLDEPNKIKNIEREIVILHKINHPTIARLLETIETSHQIYLILQYGGANSLYKYLLSKPEHRLSEQQAKSIFKIILTAVHYLHSKNITHRDIKAQNILLNRYKELKLIDFGFSLVCKNNQTIDTFCGTPTYMAPEIVSKKDHVPVYTDMWSLGILFFVMLQGNYPFRAKSQNELFQKIKKGMFQYIHDDISQRSKILIRGLLHVNPLDRFTAQELMAKNWYQWYQQKCE